MDNKPTKTFHYCTANPIVYGILKEYARHNRKYPTVAESTLWEYLCSGKLGANFRRQHIIGEFIADFVCLKSRLIIELDGGYHQLPQQKTSDEERTRWLNKQGFTVLRFSNEEAICNTGYVINKIKEYLKQ
ncbi:endonuclease domain-containing protein [Xylanibacter rodentium]|jgi:5-methyltetrahydrofolate--homocysteine methyltransferase|uniref:DUF559 domain-containing protein n=1 Tax=Xylanibacter rodentium TaxID=2736289 RepID=A0ABX2AUH4_9BACT|nr:DUF559 domain-containing protein [Xylanibacter rodentium]NPE12040.1 DUF559 domain-containing protein [Prevotella sp. PJ1A]NPE14290.1 DUF559 domain-containing protein [Xylanibacter rodentium]NPE39459.1 DUF559 domain-containing protein [Prevotella sp. PCJ2]